MIVVLAGSFVMGRPPDEVNRGDDEGPLRQVSIAEDFVVGTLIAMARPNAEPSFCIFRVPEHATKKR